MVNDAIMNHNYYDVVTMLTLPRQVPSQQGNCSTNMFGQTSGSPPQMYLKTKGLLIILFSDIVRMFTVDDITTLIPI